MIVITGASDGLGLQLAKLYQESGKKVVSISRRKCKYADENIVHDLQKGSDIKLAAEAVIKLNEPIEAIINCVGVFSREGFGTITEDEVERLMSTNVKAPLLLVSGLIERIKKDQTDTLNVISTAGVVGKAGEPTYSASKWAERGFTKSLQEELKDTPCRVISFCPGGIRTNFSEKALGYNASSDDWMKPEDLAGLIKHILDLPKNIEVSEVIINRKQQSERQ